MTAERLPAVTTIIVSHRTPELTDRAARSALASTSGEVIVVDNASGDDTTERLSAIPDPRLSVIANPVNVGFGSACNMAARRARDEVLIFLNSDAVLDADAASALEAEVSRHGGRCLAAPRLVGPDGVVQRSVELLPRPSDLVLRGLGMHLVASWLSRLPALSRLIGSSRIAREYQTAVEAQGPIDVSMLSGACFAVGRGAFMELGGFDQRYFMYLEDADLCRRAAASGFALRFLPGVTVEHVGGASSPGDYRFAPLHAAGITRYLRRWHGRAGLLVALGIFWCRAIGLSLLRPRAAPTAWRALGSALRVAR